MIDAKTVAAIVVTYNRRKLLLECLNAILAQTKPVDRIIVIDNKSTDGTHENLREYGYLDNQLIDYVRLADNIGGAGGFFEGIKRAYEAGYDYFWIMDDDGLPDAGCLARLFSVVSMEGLSYAAPNLIDDSERSHFYVRLKYAKTKIVNFRGGPFNGVLIGREIVHAVGFPMKNYFIWGDEYEYTNRIQDAGFPMVMVSDAIHRHRSTEFSYGNCPRPYHLVRNSIYTIRLSKGLYVSKRVMKLQLLQVVVKLMVYGAIKLNVKQMKSVVMGIYHGLNDSLTQHQEECKWWGVDEKGA